MFKNILKPKNWICFGTFIIFLSSFILHFLYNWTNKNVIIGAFTPIDESIWEHTKLAVFPIIAWYTIYFFIFKKKEDINMELWFVTMLINMFVSALFIPLLYYFINTGFGIENIIVNIIILFLSLAIGSLVSAHYYTYGKGINIIYSACITCFIVFVYILFTYSKFNLPIFIETIYKM